MASQAPGLLLSPAMYSWLLPVESEERKEALLALSLVETLRLEESVYLILTRDSVEQIQRFCWEPADAQPELAIVYKILIRWITGSGSMLTFDLGPSAGPIDLHPCPTEAKSRCYWNWCVEVARAITEMDDSGHIGVLSVKRVAGKTCLGYDGNHEGSVPLIGPDELTSLGSCLAFQLPLTHFQVPPPTFKQAKKNMQLLGCISIDKPKGSSHYQCRFPSGYKWPLDVNLPSIPDEFLRELAEELHLSIGHVRFVLSTGIEISPSLKRPLVVYKP